MKQPLVSVIMAVYNAEPYLRRCLDSIQAQTLMDFDVILVDDGSTDNSLVIAKEYARQDCRFRVYHKDNGGVSSTRQYGIERLAEKGGKYSIHVDPDDWVEPQMLERLCRKAEESKADMVICDYYQNMRNKQLLRRQDPKSEESREVMNGLFQGLHGSLWNKLIRSACYKEAGIRFPQGMNYCEDFYMNIGLLQKCIRKVAYLPEAFYHYDNYSNPQAETQNTDKEYTNYKCMEIVRRCRDLIPIRERKWQFGMFEAKHAFGILMNGTMKDNDFKHYFSDMTLSVLLHSCCYRPFLLTTLLAAKTPLSLERARKLFGFYQRITG